MYKTYGLWLHFKQGDDFNGCLENSKGNVTEALHNWANSFEDNKRVCLTLANALRGVNVEVFACTHEIEFVPNDKEATEVLEKLVAEQLLHSNEFEDEED